MSDNGTLHNIHNFAAVTENAFSSQEVFRYSEMQSDSVIS